MVLPSSVNAVISALDKVQMQKDITYLEETAPGNKHVERGEKTFQIKVKIVVFCSN